MFNVHLAPFLYLAKADRRILLIVSAFFCALSEISTETHNKNVSIFTTILHYAYRSIVSVEVFDVARGVSSCKLSREYLSCG